MLEHGTVRERHELAVRLGCKPARKLQRRVDLARAVALTIDWVSRRRRIEVETSAHLTEEQRSPANLLRVLVLRCGREAGASALVA